jgi:hypothetical protein
MCGRVLEEGHERLLVVAAQVAALTVTRAPGGQHADDASTVVTTIHIVAKEDNDRWASRVSSTERASSEAIKSASKSERP